MVHRIADQPVHLGLGATAVAEPPFTGMAWYADYERRHAADGAEGRLVSLYEFTEDWTSWECHPAGDELVLCTAGRIVLHQELPDGTTATIALGPGDYAINPPGCWHTADVPERAAAVFVTAGMGTSHRPR